jgi:hypothetical protein
MSGFFGGGGTAYSNFTGSSTTVTGSSGLVPAPAAGKNTRYLASDASFGELPLYPQYKNTTASRYIGNTADAYSNNAAPPTIKVRYFHTLYVPTDGQVDVLAVRLSSAPSPAFNIHLALWNVNEDGTVGTYVIGNTGSSGTTAAATINISVTATNIYRGYYYMSFTSDSTPAGNVISVASGQCTSYGKFLGTITGNPSDIVIWNYTCLTSYDQTTHETFALTNSPAGLTQRRPDMAFQYV